MHRSYEEVSKSIGLAFPDVKIIVGDNLEQTQEKLYQTLVDRGISKIAARKTADNFTDLDAGQSIFKGNKPVAVVINKAKANTRTAGHEVWELILNNAFNRDAAKLKEFRDTIDKTLRKDGYSDIADKLDKFVAKYKGDVQFTEFMAEFGGYLVEGGLDIKNISAKEQTLLDHIKEIINKFAKALIGKEVFLKDATPKDIVAFMTTISKKIAEGKDIAKYMVEGEAPPNATGIRAVRQSVSVMKGQESMKKFGLSYVPNNTRVVAEALEKRQRSKYGMIPRNDRSQESLKKISKWMKQEIEYFINLMGEKSGKGWYGELYQRALNQTETIFPEFKTDPNAKDLFTMLIAITSDGTRVLQNFNLASQAYDVYRKSKSKKLPTTLPSVRIKSVENNLKVLKNLLEEYEGNVAEIKKYLLRVDTINNINKERRAAGLDNLATSWPATFKVPVASSLFGPKLGMFYANLSGMENYPTLDTGGRDYLIDQRKLIPSINGCVTDKGIKVETDRLKSLLGNSSL